MPRGGIGRPVFISRSVPPVFLFILAAMVSLASLSPGDATAQEVAFRRFAADQGLVPTSVSSLALDREGFLWIGSEGGLFRYEGLEMRPWGAIGGRVRRISASPGGGAIAVREDGALFEVTLDGTRPLPGPDGRWFGGARDAAYDSTGSLWVVGNRGLAYRDTGGVWTRRTLPLAGGEYHYAVRPHAADTVGVLTNRGVWLVSGTLPPSFLTVPLPPDDPSIVDLFTTQDRRILALTFVGRILELRADGPREVFRLDTLGIRARAIDLVARSGTLWLSTDRYLLGLREDKHPLVLGSTEGLDGAGPMIVDHEGSLWVGSYVGLYQFPEPETLIWTERDGLPSNHTRYVARSAGRLWINTWQGGAYMRGVGDEVGRLPSWTPSRAFVDSRGVLWAGSREGLLEIVNGRESRRHLDDAVHLLSLSEGADGTIWMGTSRGLLRRRPGGVPVPVALPGPAGPKDDVEGVLVDGRGRLWVARGEIICHVDASRASREGPEAGSECARVEGLETVTGNGLLEQPSGTIWMTSNRLGVLRRTSSGWEPIPATRDLASLAVLSMSRSPRGGVWLAGHGILQRVIETADAGGWRVVERLSAWQGLPAPSAEFVLEEANGDLWLTTSQGVVNMPERVRFAVPEPPRVLLVDARVDDRPVSLAGPLELPYDRNRLELRFAAASYRDPARIRYQVRLSSDEPWQNTAGQPSFRWVDLPPGAYAAEIRASLDGRTWSTSSGTFEFRITPPWYRTWWALAGFALAAAAGLLAIHRFRVAHLVELERQRTRIAMDLHDEIGSGLGSIRILSGLLISSEAGPEERSRIAGEIATTTGEIGTTLGQIVWTLDPRAKSMEEIAGRLAELGQRLFAGGETEFETVFPDRWPDDSPGQLVRRNVVLVGLEALHNVARHAGAGRVRLTLEAMGSRRWRLAIVDDGIGTAAGDGEGLGLRSMRRRAAQIGAELTHARSAAGGTEVSLIFDTANRERHPEHRMNMRWRRGGRDRRFRQ